VARVPQAAPKLAGALLTVGGSRAAQVARTMESYAREGSLADADQLLARLHEEIAALTRAMVAAQDLERPSVAAS
jgi:HPt (histidine-containing phosphotransfer) domain-containing protein